MLLHYLVKLESSQKETQETLLMLAYPDCPEKEAIKQMSARKQLGDKMKTNMVAL